MSTHKKINGISYILHFYWMVLTFISNTIRLDFSGFQTFQSLPKYQTKKLNYFLQLKQWSSLVLNFYLSGLKTSGFWTYRFWTLLYSYPGGESLSF